MDIPENIGRVLMCPNLHECGQRLIDFSDFALAAKDDRVDILRDFYWELYSLNPYSYVSDVFSDFLSDKSLQSKPYQLFVGKAATSRFLSWIIPRQTSPVKSLKEIRKTGEYIRDNFIAPTGETISEDEVIAVLDYIETQFSFMSKVFSGEKPIFFVLDSSHKLYNGDCLYLETLNGCTNYFFLYTVRSTGRKQLPIGVLFHELGHALLDRYKDSIPLDSVMKYTESLHFNNYNHDSEEAKIEIIAEAIGMGLIYQSPFESQCLIPEMHVRDRIGCSVLAEELLKHL